MIAACTCPVGGSARRVRDGSDRSLRRSGPHYGLKRDPAEIDSSVPRRLRWADCSCQGLERTTSVSSRARPAMQTVNTQSQKGLYCRLNGERRGSG
jgi:hypothetical protein